MAVVCACIPSLRPLFSILGHGLPNAFNTTMDSTKTKSSSKRLWSGSGKQSNGNFSQLEELDDLTLSPVTHEVSVQGGGATLGQSAENLDDLPEKGIKVETQITLTTSDRIHYNDRLF